MSPPHDRPVNPADPGSVAAHAAADACSYTWTESLAHATARVTRWMTPAAATGWRPTAGDRAYWTGHVVPTHETVTCRVTAVTTDGPATGAARGISVTLTTDRASSTAEEHGVGSYAVLVGRRSDRTWRVRALTVTG